MTTMTQPAARTGFERPAPSGLADVIETILDKGLVIDAYVRVSLVGIELLTIDLRVVVASVDTYLRFAEAVGRLDITQNNDKGLPELLGGAQESGAKSKTKGALEAAGDKVRDVFSSDTDTEADTGESETDSGKSKTRTKSRKG